MTTSASSRLGSVPQEVLEHIAFCAATQSPVGPPSRLLPLLLTCRDIYQALSFEDNAVFYARIFRFQFDTRSVLRRLGSHASAPRVLANELKKRWSHLKRMRAWAHARIAQHTGSPSAGLTELLWLAYLMMLENDGKNELQLLDYAGMDVWLMKYWFDDEGASLAQQMIQQHQWPAEDEKNAIAMWLFWFLLRPDAIMRNITTLRRMLSIVKLIALAANHYPICHPSWTKFLPRPEAMMSPSLVTHFSETYRLRPPTLGPAAILVFLNLTLRPLLPRANYPTGYSFQAPASASLDTRQSEDWDTDWYRCISLGQSDRGEVLSKTYKLGSWEGVWEGVFVYTEFTFYTSLLSGGAPSVLDHCLTAQHRQTWKLREYYYLVEDGESIRETSRPLGPGDPLEGHFPSDTRFQETADAVQVQEPGRDPIYYWRPSHATRRGRKVMDVIILGEGHSAWGQFNLRGRVRPLDGMISFCKEYAESDRGRWLYRGYLVGNVNGYVSGRWRDTLTPFNVEGYEGCFVMSRRR